MNTRLKIIFETGIIADLHKNQAGLYRYADELLKKLYQEKDKKIDLFYSIFSHERSKSTSTDIENIFTEKEYNIEPVNKRYRRKFLLLRKEKPFRYLYKKMGIKDYKTINYSILKNKFVYHSPYYPIPKEINKLTNVKKVVTIHDLIPIIFPNYNTDKILIEEIINSIENDGFVICVSNHTKQDLLKLYPQIKPERIFVSYLAANPSTFYVNKDRDIFKEIQKKYTIPSRYFLGLSTLEPRKNIDHVIRNFIKFIQTNNINDLSLVLVGSKGWNYEKIFEEYENSKELKNKVIITGRIPDEDLASVYSNAEAFFYMSIYEGFGLPPLEAMQCGVPTVVSNISSLPEVVESGGILLDPYDNNSLQEIMLTLYSDKNVREEYSNKALERSKYFSWEKTCDEHINIYKKIIEL